jgi:flagellar biosynthesis/type III secretory pathway protein FliH
MTNEEIWAKQREHRAELERRETVVERLRAAAAAAPEPPGRELLLEAALTIELMKAEALRAAQELRDEQREAQRSAGEAFNEGRHEGMAEARGY